LFKLLTKYRPESAVEKKTRLVAVAEQEAKNADVKQGSKPNLSTSSMA
jgi:hypothetical protein